MCVSYVGCPQRSWKAYMHACIHRCVQTCNHTRVRGLAEEIVESDLNRRWLTSPCLVQAVAADLALTRIRSWPHDGGVEGRAIDRDAVERDGDRVVAGNGGLILAAVGPIYVVHHLGVHRRRTADGHHKRVAAVLLMGARGVSRLDQEAYDLTCHAGVQAETIGPAHCTDGGRLGGPSAGRCSPLRGRSQPQSGRRWRRPGRRLRRPGRRLRRPF